jgi:hypothetical protein
MPGIFHESMSTLWFLHTLLLRVANNELLLKISPEPPADASLIGWNLFLPADSAWSDEAALEHAAAIARSDDYRGEREVFRDWWRLQIDRGAPPEEALRDLVQRADKLNAVVREMNQRTRTLRSFAILGSGLGAAGFWFPPLALAGGCLAIIGVGAEWLWRASTAAAIG